MIKKVFFIFVLGFSLTMNGLLVNEVIALRKIRDGLANELRRQLLLRLQDKLEEQMQEPKQPQQRLNSPQYPIITGI